MKLELFFIRSLFLLATIATIGTMANMLQNNAVHAQKIAQINTATSHAG